MYIETLIKRIRYRYGWPLRKGERKLRTAGK